MNKKNIAGRMMVLFLTGCSGENLGEVTFGYKETVKEECLNQNENKSEAKNSVEIEKDEVQPNQGMNIEEIFAGNIGETYRHTGYLEYERIEKLVEVTTRKHQRGVFYCFQGYDISDMKDGKKRYYGYSCNISEKGMEKDGVLIFDREAAEKGESWSGKYVTSEWEEFDADFKVIKWDENFLKVEVVPSIDNHNEKFKNYKAIHTFERNKGATGIDIEIPFENGEIYPLGISIMELSAEQRIELQKKRWPEIEEEFIEADRILKGYYDINDEYYLQLKDELGRYMKSQKVSGEEAQKILEDFYDKMPEDSLRAVEYIDDLARIVWEETNDPYYILLADREYVRRIKAINDIYEKDKTLMPIIDDYTDFLMSKNIMVTEDFINYNLKGKSKRRLDMYLDSYIRPVNFSEYQFVEMEGFYDQAIVEDDIEEVKNYFNYRKYSCNKRDNRYEYDLGENLKKSLEFIEDQIDKGDSRYETFIQEVSQAFLNLRLTSNKLKRKILDEYIEERPNGRYRNDAIEKLKELETNSPVLHRDKLYSNLKKGNQKLNDVENQNIVEVWNGYEFNDAIKDNTVIKVMDDIVFIEDKDKIIDGIKNLTIVGDGEVPVNISKHDSYAILRVNNSENITFRNLSIGSEGKARTDIDLSVSNSSNIKIENTILYGDAGVLAGVQCENVQDLSLVNIVLADYMDKGLELEQVQGIRLNNIIISKDLMNGIFMKECTCVEKERVVIESNEKEESVLLSRK